jgi:hypothetical protein
MSGIAGKFGAACVSCALLMMGVPAAAQTHDVLKKNGETAQAFLDALTPAPDAPPAAAARRTRSLTEMKPSGRGAAAKLPRTGKRPAPR